METAIELAEFFFFLGKDSIINCFTLLSVARLLSGASCGVGAAVVDADYFLELKGDWLVLEAVRGVRVEDVLYDLLEIQHIDLVILSEYRQRPCEVVFALDFLGCDIPQQLEVNALLDFKVSAELGLELFQDQINDK